MNDVRLGRIVMVLHFNVVQFNVKQQALKAYTEGNDIHIK
jgi:hypothetical protein